MNEKYDIKTIIKFIIVVLLISLAFYFITVIVTDKKQSTTKSITNEAVIQYEEIIIGEMYNQSENEYYVFLKDEEDPYINTYETDLSSYKSKDNALKVYYVNLNSAFNKKYIGKKNNISKHNFKIKTTALIKIKNQKIAEIYETESEIQGALSNMNK